MTSKYININISFVSKLLFHQFDKIEVIQSAPKDSAIRVGFNVFMNLAAGLAGGLLYITGSDVAELSAYTTQLQIWDTNHCNISTADYDTSSTASKITAAIFWMVPNILAGISEILTAADDGNPQDQTMPILMQVFFTSLGKVFTGKLIDRFGDRYGYLGSSMLTYVYRSIIGIFINVLNVYGSQFNDKVINGLKIMTRGIDIFVVSTQIIYNNILEYLSFTKEGDPIAFGYSTYALQAGFIPVLLDFDQIFQILDKGIISWESSSLTDTPVKKEAFLLSFNLGLDLVMSSLFIFI